MSSRAIGLAALTVLELPAHEQVSAAAQAGYSHVGLRLIPVTGQTLPVFDEAQVKRRLDETGVAVLDVEIFRLDAHTDVSAFEPTLALAQRLGASEILVHGADPEEARLVQSFGELCELAQRHGLAANLEPMPWVEVSNVAKAKRIIAAAGKRNAALLVDAIHFYRTDNELEELRGVPHRYMQLCDAHPGRPMQMQELIRQARGDRLFPGEGALDLKSLMRALPSHLPISVETPIARKMDAYERAKRALEATTRLLG